MTQATVSRDIRELKLTKIAMDNGKAEIRSDHGCGFRHDGKICQGVCREGFIVHGCWRKNIVVIKTVSGMAGAVCGGS